jgi:hypothetical protein
MEKKSIAKRISTPKGGKSQVVPKVNATDKTTVETSKVTT